MIDEREMDNVRAWLATAEVPDLRTDVGATLRAATAGARRRRVRRIAGSVALIVAMGVAVPGIAAIVSRDADGPPAGVRPTPSPDGPFSCAYQPLPVPDDLDTAGVPNAFIAVFDVDPSGRYVVAVPMSGTTMKAGSPVLWDNGSGRVLTALADAHPVAVNEHGHVAGHYIGNLGWPGKVGGWVYREGAVLELGMPAGGIALGVMDINSGGDVLGNVYYNTSGETKVAVWHAADLTRPEVLPRPAAGRVYAERFTADGGILARVQPDFHPYLWTAHRSIIELPVPPSDSEVTTYGVGGDWVVAGYPGRGGPVGLRWKVSTGEVAPVTLPDGLPDGFRASSIGITATGTMLLTGLDPAGAAFMVRGDHVAVLPVPDGHEVLPEEMNRDGTVVIGIVRSPRDKRTFPASWTC